MTDRLLDAGASAILMGKVVDVLAILDARVSRVVLNGPLNEEQRAHLTSALELSDGLKDLFRAERQRLLKIHQAKTES